MIKRSLKKTKVTIKNDFLNKDQRKELKRLLLEKFVKLYGLSNPKAVKVLIDKFFKTTKNVNAKSLLKLEE